MHTGLSGNEIFCLRKKGLAPGELIVGNSVWSLGVVGGISAGFKTLAGGEIHEITEIVHDGRAAALERMEAYTDLKGAVGITGVTSELVFHGASIEFLSIGSAVHRDGYNATRLEFTSSSDGQELYCQLDSGFKPLHFAFGNVAYAIGVGGGIGGFLQSFSRGEVKQYSEIFNVTRHLALERIKDDARKKGANVVAGIRTSIIPLSGLQEMAMIGTASRHDSYPPEYDADPATSDLTCEEAWNMANLGYLPVRLVLGVSVYSLGIVGGLAAAFKSLGRGEIDELTRLVYEARENAIHHVMSDAAHAGADDVVGIKTYVYELGGGMIEFLAIGTAVKKFPGVTTVSENLIPQAVMNDKDTFINLAETQIGRDLNQGDKH